MAPRPGTCILDSTRPNHFQILLREFCTSVLAKDDVFQPEFLRNIVFYGSKKEDLIIEFDAFEELTAWNSETRTFLAGSPNAKVASGPYVFTRERTWQPWRVYHDFNGTFMRTFKPSPLGSRE